QCLGTDTPDFLDAAHLGDAHHHGAENDRSQQHLDQFDEAIGERLQLGANVGKEEADRTANDDTDQHLNVELGIPACRSLFHG
nr:hypothetical protein [Tanacetum cinerariifolium]